MKERKPFWRQKTTGAGIGGLVGIAAAYFTGEIGAETAIATGIPAVIAVLFPEKKKGPKEKFYGQFMIAAALITGGLLLSLIMARTSESTSGTERSLHVLSSGYLFHDGSSGVSGIPLPTNGHVEQCLVQPIGSSIRHMADGVGPVTGTTGFVVPANDYFELASGDIVRDWRFSPPPGTGVTVYYQNEGIPF